jgi:hypothetical protein
MRPNPLRDAWYHQRWQAQNTRNIKFDLTFEEWLDVWNQSGKLHLRGRGVGKYCMARKNDSGPYEYGNVYITLFEDNNKDQHRWNNRLNKKIGNSKIKLKSPNGVVLHFNNLSQAARQLNLKYASLWKELKLKQEYKGYQKI